MGPYFFRQHLRNSELLDQVIEEIDDLVRANVPFGRNLLQSERTPNGTKTHTGMPDLPPLEQ